MKVIWQYLKHLLRVPLLLLERNAVPVSAGALCWIRFPQVLPKPGTDSVLAADQPGALLVRILVTLATIYLAWRLHRW